MNTNYQYQCIITRIVDGDTIDCSVDLGFDIWMHNVRVRLHGIDAPETRTKDLREKRMGELAMERVATLLPVGTLTTLYSIEYNAKDIYNRILADFYVPSEDGNKLTSILLKERLAAVYYPDDKEATLLEHQENAVYWLG